MAFLLDRDIPNGALATAVVSIDGQNHVLFRAKKIQVSADIQTTDTKVMGTTRIQTKNNGAKQQGSGTIYYGSNLFTDMVLEYLENNRTIYFDLTITNDDPTTTIGQQIMTFYGCKLFGDIPLAVMDLDAPQPEQSFQFSYETVKMLTPFVAEAALGG